MPVVCAGARWRARYIESMKLLASLLYLFTRHVCYWGIPHRRGDDIIQVCYECGATREVKADLSASTPAVNQDGIFSGG